MSQRNSNRIENARESSSATLTISIVLIICVISFYLFVYLPATSKVPTMQVLLPVQAIDYPMKKVYLHSDREKMASLPSPQPVTSGR
ncbi:hypothetical protein [Pararhizobium arenae]|uniref:hypothetical protein n=1 Tax=Pararhizobium arenae TaxID=1856850 RepID=UPI000A4B3444|nr:hypothetical protein [Pararhizobium arenae]